LKGSGHDFVNTGKRKKKCMEGKEIKMEKNIFDKVLNTIAYQVNRSERFRNCPIEEDDYGSRKRKV
jgi:hypothetical protein